MGRVDGKLIKGLSPMRRMMPFIMRGRVESTVYFEQKFRMGPALQYQWQHAPDRSSRIFPLLLCALARTLAARPQMHRFVAGRRLWQRGHIDLSFAVKKSLDDDAPMSTVKLRLQGNETIGQVQALMDRAIKEGRGARKNQSEKEMALALALPRFATRFALASLRWLDFLGLVPRAMLDADPMYASAFVANLGSIGLDAPFHHLYEYGTIPLFVAIGRVKKDLALGDDGQPITDDFLTIRYSFDERVTDGFYCAGSLEYFKQLVEQPWLLEGDADAGPAH